MSFFNTLISGAFGNLSDFESVSDYLIVFAQGPQEWVGE